MSSYTNHPSFFPLYFRINASLLIVFHISYFSPLSNPVHTVYPNDKQMNYDGLIFHAPCSKCADCGCNVTVSNFAIADEGEGKKELLCKVHYKARFNAAGGVYAGAGKFTKQSEREVVSADRASRSASVSSPIKAGTGLEKDSNYTLERSVTTPDKRPSMQMPKAETTKEEVDKAPEISSRRASLKSTGNSKVAEEIAEENSRSASTPNRTAEDASSAATAEDASSAATVFTAAEETAASTCAKCDCANNCTACGTDACACGDDCACEKKACGEEGSTCCENITTSENLNGDYEGGDAAAETTCAKCDCANNCTACGTDACACGDDCACKK